MNYEDLIQFAPDNWNNLKHLELRIVSRESAEYDNLVKISSSLSDRIKFIERYENIYRYVQFLVRQQHLIALYPMKQYYTVRRFVTVHDADRETALTYQLDSRRVSNISFKMEPDTHIGDVIFVVSVVTDNPEAEFKPTRDSDYYIEYIIKLD